MPPKKSKNNKQTKQIGKTKPKEIKLTNSSKQRGSKRNLVENIQPATSIKEDICMVDENLKKDQQGKSYEDLKKETQILESPKQEVQIGSLIFTQKPLQTKLNTPQSKIVQPQQIDSKVVQNSTLKIQKKSWKIGMIGFTSKLRDLNKNEINALNGEYIENIQQGIDVLIAFRAVSTKTKFCFDVGIPVVNSKWLTDSLKEGQFIDDLNQYKLKVFEGIKLNLLGFNENEYMTIKQFIVENKGDCVKDLNEALKSVQNQQSGIDLTNQYINIINQPATDETWLLECMKRQMFVYPRHYIINRRNFSEIKLFEEEEIKQRMKEIDCSQKEYNYLSNCIFYVHQSYLDDKKYKTITKLITLGGGFYVTQIMPCTTHIITPHYTKSDYSDFTSYGNSVLIVHPEWLQESFIILRKLNEADYKAQIIENSQLNSQQIISSDQKQKNDTNFRNHQLVQEINEIAQNKNRQTLSNNSVINNTVSRISSLNGNYFIGVSKQISQVNILQNDENQQKQEKKKKTFKQQKALIKPKGILFKHCTFYLEETQYVTKLKQYKTKIFEQQGEITPIRPTPDENLKAEIFYILDDSPKSEEIMQKTHNSILYLSFRWIDFCIERKTLLKYPSKFELIHLVPFPQTMPIQGFQDLTIYYTGSSHNNEKVTMKEAIKILGAQCEYSEGKTQILVCGNKQCKKVKEIINDQLKLSPQDYELKWKDIKVVDSGWLLECITYGKLLDINQYLLKF